MDHQRFKQVSTDGTTLYINAFGVMAELIAPGTTAARWNDYLSVGNVKVGVRFTDVTTATVTTRYFHTDHLGSIAVITNEAGTVVECLAGACPPARFARPEECLGQAALPARCQAEWAPVGRLDSAPFKKSARVRTQNRFPLLLNARSAPTIRQARSRA